MFARALSSLWCLVCLSGLWLSAAEQPSDEPQPAETAATADSEPIGYDWTGHQQVTYTLENDLAVVVVSEYRGAIEQFRLKESHPIPIPEFRGGEGSDTNTKAPLAVLAGFKDTRTDPTFGFSVDGHNYLARMGLYDYHGRTEGPWRRVNDDQDRAELVLKQDSPILPLAYQLTYRMDPVRPTVHVELEVRHTGGEPVDIQPTLIAINGIHQDDPRNEDYDMRIVASFDGTPEGEDAEFDKWSIPTHGEVKPLRHPGLGSNQVRVPADRLNYVGLKSRFFTAFWSPGTLEILGQDQAEDDPEAGLDPFDSPIASERGGFDLHLEAKGYHQQIIDGEYANQAWIKAEFLPSGDATEFRLAADQTLRSTWSITAAGMTDVYLETLTPAEQRIEYTDGFYNFFKVLVQLIAPILDLIVLVVVNYGVAVIVFVIVIKLLLHRLNVKQQRGLARMQEIAPKMQALKERYKHDPQTLQRKMFELYREEKFNPMAGCMPMLIQMPIFFAVFQTFRHYAPMREHSFLWISDLTMPDQMLPLFSIGGFLLTVNPLPLLYIAFWFWAGMSQKIPADAPDQQKQMAKLMRWLPIVFGIFLYNFPAGLMLYMLCSSVIGNLEMRYLRKKYGITGTAMPT